MPLLATPRPARVLLRRLVFASLGAALLRSAGASAAGPPMTITVDAREAPKKLFHARLTIPAAPGPLTLAYPKWLPGEHGPTGPVVDMAALKLTAAGAPLAWRRDGVDLHSVRCEVPPGAASVEAELDFLSPVGSDGFTSAATASEKLAVVSWNQLLLYPKGRKTDDVVVSARLVVPAGWKHATALPETSVAGGAVEFAPVTLTTLVDSPVLIGAHLATYPLAAAGPKSPEILLSVAADSEAALVLGPEREAGYKALAAEALALFGAAHFTKYRFLVTLSDHVAHFGLEHHESSDNRGAERAFLDDAEWKLFAGLLPHELVHSWNGKYRRPAGLATGDFETPMKGELLWVYEGLTQYLGFVLATRSGLVPPQEAREQLAVVAARLDARPGRLWRPLVDTADAAQKLFEASDAWESRRRSVDFYDEMLLVWLEADMLIREKSGGKRSLDDFCKRFHGPPGGPPAVKPYDFDEIVKTLSAVEPHDWAKFLKDRVYAVRPKGVAAGIAAAGWKLSFDDAANALDKAREESRQALDMTHSAGLLLKTDGSVTDVVAGSPADRAGVGPGMKLLGVNGRRYSATRLKDAVAATKAPGTPLALLVENGDFFFTATLEGLGGARVPHLVRDAGRPDLLEALLRSTAPPAR